jgi:2-keto-4-pentenoate hydratase/2-oxohepta-3-ene-1,7-dioic acid hydratase in catechol pathway
VKLITFQSTDRQDRLGVLIDDGLIVDLAAADAAKQGRAASYFSSMMLLIEAGERGLDHAREILRDPPHRAVLKRSDVVLRAPIPLPPQIRDFSAFELHILQAGRAIKQLRSGEGSALSLGTALSPGSGPPAWYRQPLYYKSNRFAVCGTDTDIRWPDYSQLMDYELELACVIGRAGRDIPSTRAHEYIFGYTIFNDFSARDAQAAEMEGPFGPAKGKDFDDANAFGPCIVTRDEIPHPYALTMTASVNGVERARGSSGAMHWSFEQMIEHVSRGETLHPGEIFGSGTIGNGCGLESLTFLQDGDVVELEIEGIGILRNRVLRRPGARASRP